MMLKKIFVKKRKRNALVGNFLVERVIVSKEWSRSTYIVYYD